jgi:hypothetical protein
MNLIRRYETRISDSNMVRGLTETGWEWAKWINVAKDRKKWRVSGCINAAEVLRSSCEHHEYMQEEQRYSSTQS